MSADEEAQRAAWPSPHPGPEDDAPELSSPGRDYILYAEQGLLVLVEAGTPWTIYDSGRFVIPTRFSLSSPPVALDIEIDGGRAVCRQLTLAAADGPGITGGSLRNIPLRQLVSTAVEHAAIRTERRPDGTIGIGRVRTADQDVLDEFLAAYSAAAHKPRRGRRLSNEDLAQVATAYRQAIADGDPAPTLAVATELHLSYGTARRRVAEARRRQFLGPTTPRRAGEGGKSDA